MSTSLLLQSLCFRYVERLYAQCHNDECCYARFINGNCHYDECHCGSVMLSVIMTSVIMLIVIMMSVIVVRVVTTNVIMLSSLRRVLFS